MIATTQDQSERLLRCGVSADTADMLWARLDETRDHNLYAVPWYTPRLPNRKITDNDIPAWSLSALCELLPKQIDDEYNGRLYTFRIKYEHTSPDFPWQIKYESAILSNSPLFFDKSLIETCVKAIEWLKENNYKLNEQ